MKATIELPDDLFITAEKRAAESRTTLRALVERGLRRELRGDRRAGPAARSRIRWVTVNGGLPTGVEPADRPSMSDWIHRNR